MHCGDARAAGEANVATERAIKAALNAKIARNPGPEAAWSQMLDWGLLIKADFVERNLHLRARADAEAVTDKLIACVQHVTSELAKFSAAQSRLLAVQAAKLDDVSLHLSGLATRVTALEQVVEQQSARSPSKLVRQAGRLGAREVAARSNSVDSGHQGPKELRALLVPAAARAGGDPAVPATPVAVVAPEDALLGAPPAAAEVAEPPRVLKLLPPTPGATPGYTKLGGMTAMKLWRKHLEGTLKPTSRDENRAELVLKAFRAVATSAEEATLSSKEAPAGQVIQVLRALEQRFIRRLIQRLQQSDKPVPTILSTFKEMGANAVTDRVTEVADAIGSSFVTLSFQLSNKLSEDAIKALPSIESIKRAAATSKKRKLK